MPNPIVLYQKNSDGGAGRGGSRQLRILTLLEDNGWSPYHIAGSLEEMGHTVIRFPHGDSVGRSYFGAAEPARRTRTHAFVAEARRLIETGGLDLIFCYVYDDFLDTQTAAELASLGVPMVNYNVDMVGQWYRQIRTARYFSRILCAQTANMEAMARYGARTLYFPMASRALAVTPLAESIAAAPVTFVGTATPYRIRVLRRLVDAGIDVAVYGRNWLNAAPSVPQRSARRLAHDLRHYGAARLRQEGVAPLCRMAFNRVWPEAQLDTPEMPLPVLKGALGDLQLASIFRSSRINIGFTRMQGEDPDKAGLQQVKLRDMEVPLAGGFYLVEHADDLGRLYDIGTEIETWSSVPELVSKIERYLEDEATRSAVTAAGLRRAHADHTWKVRFNGLFRELGLIS